MKITLDDGTTWDVGGAAAVGRLTSAERTMLRNALREAQAVLDPRDPEIAAITAQVLVAAPTIIWIDDTSAGHGFGSLENGSHVAG